MSAPYALASPSVPSKAALRIRWIRRQPSALQALLVVASRPMGLIGLILLAALALCALLAPVVAPYDPATQHPGSELVPPSAEFWLGSDEFGRDLFSRILFGARTTFVIGILAVSLGAVVGVVTGLMAGYFGGSVDAIIMRVYDALLAFPAILLGIAVIAVLGPSSTNVAYAIGIAQMPNFARLTRSSVLTQRERDYALAARAVGAGDRLIMFHHVLPNCVAPLLVALSLAMGASVLAEAGLSFLGLGAQPPDPSWGGMLNASRAYLRDAPWYGIWPGLALVTLLIGLNFLADSLREALDPHRINRV